MFAETQAVDALEAVAQNSDSDIVRVLTLLAVVLICVGLPYYKLKTRATRDRQRLEMEEARLKQEADMKATQERHIQNMEERAQLIDVISKNSASMAALTTVLEHMNNTCALCKAEQLGSMNRLMESHNELRNDVHRALGHMYEKGGLPNE